MPQQRNERTIGTDRGSDMDYKEQVENLLYDGKDWGGDPESRKDLYGSAQSITDLLARAEDAEARAEKAEIERDAAVSDLETIMAYNSDTCQFCKNGKCYVRGGTKPCLPKWRGQKEE